MIIKIEYHKISSQNKSSEQNIFLNMDFWKSILAIILVTCGVIYELHLFFYHLAICGRLVAEVVSMVWSRPTNKNASNLPLAFYDPDYVQRSYTILFNTDDAKCHGTQVAAKLGCLVEI
jgi:hypothetical protein